MDTAKNMLEEIIEQKYKEIQEHEERLKRLKTAVALLQRESDTLDDYEVEGVEDKSVLRPGSTIETTRQLLQKHGKPMHIDSILKELGLGMKKKLSLTGAIHTYAKRKKIFKAFGGNVFGLIGHLKPDSE